MHFVKGKESTFVQEREVKRERGREGGKEGGGRGREREREREKKVIGQNRKLRNL